MEGYKEIIDRDNRTPEKDIRAILKKRNLEIPLLEYYASITREPQVNVYVRGAINRLEQAGAGYRRELVIIKDKDTKPVSTKKTEFVNTELGNLEKEAKKAYTVASEEGLIHHGRTPAKQPIADILVDMIGIMLHHEDKRIFDALVEGRDLEEVTTNGKIFVGNIQRAKGETLKLGKLIDAHIMEDTDNLLVRFEKECFLEGVSERQHKEIEAAIEEIKVLTTKKIENAVVQGEIDIQAYLDLQKRYTTIIEIIIFIQKLQKDRNTKYLKDDSELASIMGISPRDYNRKKKKLEDFFAPFL